MRINVILDEYAKMPTKAHDADAGFDIYSPGRVVVRKRDSAIIDTGTHFEIPRGYVGMLKSKSGLNVKFGIRGEGVIDSGFTGSVVAKLYNDSDAPVVLEEGQKIIQIVFLPIPEVELVQVDSFEQTKRGDNGFGSSGKF
jgi:dUTP pyrophosphatase